MLGNSQPWDTADLQRVGAILGIIGAVCACALRPTVLRVAAGAPKLEVVWVTCLIEADAYDVQFITKTSTK